MLHAKSISLTNYTSAMSMGETNVKQLYENVKKLDISSACRILQSYFKLYILTIL